MFFFKKSFFLIILIFLSLDFISTFIFFKNTDAWNADLYKEKSWRIVSNKYHHDLKPLVNETEIWGEKKYNLITNSLGFRDSEKKVIPKESSNNRILLIGDSFIEGVGYDYDFTLSGIIQKNYKENFEILNSAVSSYSPSIYYFKTKHIIENGYKFNKALVFLDISDPIDETYMNFYSDGTLKNLEIKKNDKNLKNIIYSFGYFLRENFIIFRLISILSDQTELLKNNIKDRYGASKMFDINIFNIDKKKLNLYKMITADRGNWTLNNKSFNDTYEGLNSSKINLIKLFNLLNENNIKSYLIIYPWPAQIYFSDKFYQTYWENFALENQINFINLYSNFTNSNLDKEEIIFENFIAGDIHWNYNGTLKIFHSLNLNGVF